MTLLIAAFQLLSHVQHIEIGQREYIGGRCYWYAAQVEVSGRWYETPEVDCGRARV